MHIVVWLCALLLKYLLLVIGRALNRPINNKIDNIQLYTTSRFNIKIFCTFGLKSEKSLICFNESFPTLFFPENDTHLLIMKKNNDLLTKNVFFRNVFINAPTMGQSTCKWNKNVRHVLN